MQDIIDYAKKISEYKLCNSCLGRQFAKVGHGLTNEERGKKLRKEIGIDEVSYEECWLCEGLIGEIEKFSEMVLETIKEYEFETFLIGCKIDEDILERENKISTPYSESIKREINREIGKLVLKKTGKEVDFIRPDIVIIVNTIYDTVILDVRPVFIYGRYKKFIRGIPQTKWYCRKCYGKGCEYCNYKGKMYDESVEEIIAYVPLKIFNAKDESFHGAGREDIDVLMLGNGRPFILELKEPKKRFVDLNYLQKAINEYANGKVEVDSLRYAERKEIEILKERKYTKKYRAVIKFERNGKINEAVNALRDRKIKQRTPKRVAHRRADRVRYKKVIEMRIEELKENEATIIIEAESGTYIKELITGDDGRTAPSLSELAGVKMEVKSLDVIEIGD
ncbi:MAG TPA: tRNA pseudouridine(54/55) synthase Pus10 [Thermoplasmatales archaeon]|nr:tRNA pseudouridine(54/55) synthase Pus10 [Thermoplasmatales archaeon]